MWQIQLQKVKETIDASSEKFGNQPRIYYLTVNNL